MARGAVAAAFVCVLVVALAVTSGRSRWKVVELVEQSLEDGDADGGLWAVPNSVQDDDEEVRSGQKVLNRGHVSWYWIPPKSEPPAGLEAAGPHRLDASGRLAGDPDSSKVSAMHVRERRPRMYTCAWRARAHVLTAIVALCRRA